MMNDHLPENREEGAIAVIFALLIVVLIVFTAFTVDLGMAWAERREAQTAADAGAMAGALASGDVLTDAMDFVERNVVSATPLDWTACPVPDPHFSSFTDDAGDLVTFQLVDSGVTNCIWIGSANTASTETFIGVRVPNQAVETAFARVIGVDTIDVDASAIARLSATAEAKVLPFLLPPAAATHSCLGSPPGGLSHAPCSGGTTGNYGYLGSPQHGDDSLGTVLACGSNTAQKAQILKANIAIGIDHPITTDPLWPTDPSTADPDFLDVCVGGGVPPYVPNSLDIVQGVQFDDSLQSGMVSNETFGALNAPSRLQHPQPSGLSPVLKAAGLPSVVAPLRTVRTQNSGIVQQLDNIGLWEYISSGTNLCKPDLEPRKTLWGNNASPPIDAVVGGPDATDAVLACLNSMELGHPTYNPATTVTFSPALLESPRFAVIPQIWNTVPSGNSVDRAIEHFRAVYLQATWYAGPQHVKFVDINGDEQVVFHPGEGVDDGASTKNNANSIKIDGVSALLIPVDATPGGIIDLGPDADQTTTAELVG